METGTDREALAFHVVAYAMLMRASGVITERQFAGIKIAFDTVEASKFMYMVNQVMAACNQAYEAKLRQMIDNKTLIVVP